MKVSGSEENLLLPYGNLREKQLAREMGLMILEGPALLKRASASGLVFHSILMEHGRELPMEEAPAGVPILLRDRKQLEYICGYPFHRGILAAVKRPIFQNSTDFLTHTQQCKRPLVLILPELNLQENLGALLRAAAAFSVDAVLLGPACCDPCGRRVLRSSMGSLFRLSLYMEHDPSAMEDCLKSLAENKRMAIYGSSAKTPGESCPNLTLHKAGPPCALLIGSEAQGLSPRWQQYCQANLQIPMAGGISSLNAAMAGGILLHELNRKRLKD